MIFVTLGTFPIAFTRPLDELHALCEKGIINEPIIVQSGHTEYQSQYFDIRPFIAPDELTKITQSANFIITHAGTGSLTKAVKSNKKVIAIPRRFDLGEMVDDHQFEILDVFASEGYVLPWWKENNIEKLLVDIKEFTPVPYISKKQVLIDYLENYIDSL